MSIYLIQGETLAALGDAIRAKTGETEPLTPADMATAISGLDVGGFELPDYLTEIRFGTFIENAAKSAYEVEHGLSGKPTGFVVWRGDVPSNPGSSYINAAYGHSYKYYNPSTGGTFYGTTWILNGGGGTSTASFNADETVFRLYSSSMKPSIQGNTTYYWIAWR